MCFWSAGALAFVLSIFSAPIIAAAGLEGYVADDNLVERKHIKIALAYEIFCISFVFRACWEYGGKSFFCHYYRSFKN